ncbi:hypothetical protein K488DRAFT_82691 [Vararia minispora EC-137]|uniref:Uncharacterized protein n=1 Tax=Vararia minispora EC-137 TaxID=1314806 RepID=A0ACB8QW64_9AGAM|nr:hypothetical protein K488DRAFT_82691 [Vararia minispora EC-137]
MVQNERKLNPIPPNPPRWEPTADPTVIHVSGLDTSAPVNDQIEQLEQLITLKLQNVDANFSKMQQIMSNRLLPAFKRFAVATEPVREAAKFWTSFHEQAAQVRLPTYGEPDEVPPEEQPQEEEAADTTLRKHDHSAATQSVHLPVDFDANVTPSESSFMPAQFAISSTPATVSRYHRSQGTQLALESKESEFSFSGSIESPLVRLDRDIRNFSSDDPSAQSSLHPVAEDASVRFNYAEEETIHASVYYTSPDKGKSRERSLREDVLRTTVSPLRARGKPRTPILAERNPYLPEGIHPRDWSGIVDLRDPKATTPRHDRSYASRQTPSSTPHKINVKDDDDDDDDDDNLYPPGMSPPVMVPFKAVAALNIGRSPRKLAAARIGNDLVRTSRLPQRPPHLVNESSLSSAPTPPSISYWKHNESAASSAADSTLESLLRRVRSMGQPETAPSPSSSSVSSALPAQNPLPSYYTPNRGVSNPTPPPQESYQPAMQPSVHSAPVFGLPVPEAGPVTPQPYTYDQDYQQYDFDDQNPDDSLDSLDDEINDTARPSAAFLLASANRGAIDDDDSFDSSASSDADVSLDAPVHPFARGAIASNNDSFDEDSYEEEELLHHVGETGTVEETVFGLPPAQRAARESEVIGPDGRLRMYGEQAMDDGKPGLPMESPTPYGSGDMSNFRR